MNEIATYVQTVVALIVGGFAWFLYDRKKRDNKKNVANSILLEVRAAEDAIVKIKEAVKKDNLDIDVSVMSNESWSENKYLFVRNFDEDEWNLISDFYDKSSLIDEAIKYNKSFFASNAEQIRINKQKALAGYADEAVKEAIDKGDASKTEELKELFNLKAKAFDLLYMEIAKEYLYNPVKPIEDTKLYLSNLSNLTTASVGTKLKKMAGVNKKPS